MGGRRVKHKVFRALFGLGMISLCVTTVIMTYLFYTSWKQDFRQALFVEVCTIASVEPLSVEYLKQVAATTDNKLRITWIGPTGVVIYDSTTDASTMENHSRRPEVMAAMKNGEGSDIRDSATIHSINYYEAVRLKDGSVLRVSRVGATVYKILGDAVPGIGVLFLVLTGGCYIMARRWTSEAIQPLEEVVQTWTTRGDIRPVIEDAYSEITPLLQKLTVQRDELEDMIQRLQSERNTLRYMMDEMEDGLLLARADGTVIAFNEPMKDFLGTQDLRQRQLVLLSDTPEWRRAVMQAVRRHMGSQYMVHRGEQVLRVVFHVSEAATPARRLLVVIKDITQDYLAQQRRHEFTSNVSHELKTPLTSISGYSELLAGGMFGTKDDAVELGGRIHQSALRMRELVDNILKLSRIESEDSPWNFEKVSLRQIIDDSWQLLAKKREGKHVDFTVTGDDAVIDACPSLLSEVFINLLDNAIKFGRGDSNAIAVNLGPRNGMIAVTVSDQGMGIPEDKVSRIFERFYQTEESRNSKHEGYGLGLSLVKHIMDIHGGTISVKSELGKGTTFTLNLPVSRG